MSDILEAIDRFVLHRKYPYALMIDGKWGYGKTYFVKHELIPHIKGKWTNEYDVNYISLYGVKSSEEISQRLLIQAFKGKTPKRAKKLVDGQVGDVGGIVLSSFMKYLLNKADLDGNGIKKLIDFFPDYNNNIIIFDDLERCGCDVNEVLGFINNLVEHSDASIIIVANEDEIGNCKFEKNSELQMLVAMDNRVEAGFTPTYEEKIRETVHGNEESKKESFTVDQINERKREIFANASYLQMKEKVIGVTITYEPDVERVFRALLCEKIEERSLKVVLEELIHDFVYVAERDDHKNIRTFLSFLDKASVVFFITKGSFKKLYGIVFKYMYRSMVRYKKGMEMPRWEAEYGDQSFSGKVLSFGNEDREFGFRFIDEYIVSNSINPDYVNDVLGRYDRIVEMKGLLMSDPYQKIKNWYLSEDDEVSKWLEEIIKNIKEKVYSPVLYPDLVYIVAVLRMHHIMERKSMMVFEAMMDQIKNEEYGDALEEFGFEQFVANDEVRDEYNRLRSELERSLQVAKQDVEKNQYYDAIQSVDEWGTNLRSITKETRNIRGHSFVYWIEPDNILELIEKSNNFELDQFRWSLENIYSKYVYYEKRDDDYPHLKSLSDGLDAIDTSGWGEIKKNYIGWLKETIGKHLQKMIPNDDAS